MAQRITVDDFFTGLFAELARRGQESFSWRRDRFDKAVTCAFEVFRSRAEKAELWVPFRIRLHPFHGNSSTIRAGVMRAAQRDLVSLDNPEYLDIRLKLTPRNAELFLSDLPAGPEFYRPVAQRFLEAYSAST